MDRGGHRGWQTPRSPTIRLATTHTDAAHSPIREGAARGDQTFRLYEFVQDTPHPSRFAFSTSLPSVRTPRVLAQRAPAQSQVGQGDLGQDDRRGALQPPPQAEEPRYPNRNYLGRRISPDGSFTG